MIEKKISYDINIEKPSKTKPVKQGGVFNYLGKQKTVNAPRHWRSSPKHPIAHLSYITKDEQKILIDLNLYGSLKGKPNKGPFGLPSLQGSGSGSGGGDGGSSGGDGGQGDSGPGGSDDGSGHGGPGPGDSGPGDSGPGGSDDGSGHGGPGPGSGSGQGPGAEGGFGIGPGDDGVGMGMGPEGGFGEQDETGFGTDYSDADMGPVGANAMAGVDMSMPALQSLTDKAMANARNTFSVPGVVGGLIGMMTGLPAGFTIGSTVASNMARGVTGPSDDTQEQSSVQSGPAQSTDGGDGGIITLPQYAPLVNPNTADNLVNALIARYKIDPSYFGIR